MTGNSDITADRAGTDAGSASSYAYRPSILGAGWTFRLTPNAIVWEAGAKPGRLLYRDVRRVRLTFKPASLQIHRFVMEIRGVGTPKLQIISTSWKSMVELERLDGPYADFVRELHRRLAACGAPAEYVRGRHPLSYWPGLALFLLVALGLAAATARSLAAHALAGGLFVAGFLALFLWQGGEFFRRNRPGRYTPQVLPRDLLPKV